MKVICALFGLTVISVFCAIQARHPAFTYPKTSIWQYFAKKGAAQKEPTYTARLKTSFQNWLTSKPQVTVKPKPSVPELERKWDEALLARNKAFAAYEKNTKDLIKKSEFLRLQKAYENIGNKFFDLKEKELFKPKKGVR